MGGIDMNNQVTFCDDSAEGWERALYVFLAEKEWRSGPRSAQPATWFLLRSDTKWG